MSNNRSTPNSNAGTQVGSSTGLWLLPDGVEESLPAEAAVVERLRREALDRFRVWGYEQVDPPLVEFLESLLISSGGDLDLQTVRVTDQVSGRMLGVRADMTPQVARIDAHRLDRDAVTRLCYVGPVLHARPDCFGGTRVPLQLGAELFGDATVASDIEVASLMLETLQAAGVQGLHFDLGHVAVFRQMAAAAELDAGQEAALFELLQKKAVVDIASLLAGWDLADDWRTRFAELPELTGGLSVLARAREVLDGSGEAVIKALDELEQIARALKSQYPELSLHIDLAELRGYRFHTGPVFAAYVSGIGQELARGGRYDHAGAAFGRARAATGFTADLKLLLAVGNEKPLPVDRIFAPLPAGEDAALDSRVNSLRVQGRIVVRALQADAGTSDKSAAARQLDCQQWLQRDGQLWALAGDNAE